MYSNEKQTGPKKKYHQLYIKLSMEQHTEKSIASSSYKGIIFF